MPEEPPLDASYFDMTSKKYTKRMTKIEMAFIRFLLGNKARFVPV
jgi:hypothetical protein